MQQDNAQAHLNDALSIWPILVTAVLVCGLGLTSALAPKQNQPIALIFPPWMDDHAVFDRVIAAGATPIGFGAIPGIVLVASGNLTNAQVHTHSGAWLALDGALTAALCLRTSLYK